MEQQKETLNSTARKESNMDKRSSNTNKWFLGLINVLSSCFERKPKEQFRTPRERRVMMEELSKMPDHSRFANTHVMVNKERVQNYLPQVVRNSLLDKTALEHAKKMSAKGKLIEHLDEKVKKTLTQDLGICSETIQVNVKCGSDLQDVHRLFVKRRHSRQKMLDSEIKLLGIGSDENSKGSVYVCHIYVKACMENEGS